MKRSDYVDQAGAVLDELGISWDTAVRGSGHITIQWNIDGRERYFIVPNSPSDCRGLLNSLTDLKKLLAADGIDISPKARREREEQQRETHERLLADARALRDEERALRAALAALSTPQIIVSPLISGEPIKRIIVDPPDYVAIIAKATMREHVALPELSLLARLNIEETLEQIEAANDRDIFFDVTARGPGLRVCRERSSSEALARLV